MSVLSAILVNTGSMKSTNCAINDTMMWCQVDAVAHTPVSRQGSDHTSVLCVFCSVSLRLHVFPVPELFHCLETNACWDSCQDPEKIPRIRCGKEGSILIDLGLCVYTVYV